MFDPVSTDISAGYEHYSFLAQRISIHHEGFPDWRECDMAIVGLVEDRGNPENEGAHSGADFVRRALYGLRASHQKYRMADLGNLRPGETLDDSHHRLQEVVRTLLENNVLPIVLGGTHDHTIPVLRAYEELGRRINLVNIDATSDTEPGLERGLAFHHIGRILTRHKEVINRYIHLAYQTYLVDENILAALDQHHHFKLRLGELREDLKSVEPIVRNGDFLSFDVSAIRMAEAPANACAFPFGLTGEEACQLAWFAGCSTRLSAFGIFEINPTMDYREVTSQVVATMLWYFVEGFYCRNDDLTFSPSSTRKHHVVLNDVGGEHITFYQNLKTGNWWLQTPPSEMHAEGEIVPCKPEDYTKALAGEVPSRWLNQLINLS